MRHLPRLLLGFAALSCVALPCPTVRAEDAAPAGDNAEKKDDKSPYQDLKLSKNYGLAWRKQRAEYWQKKSEESDWQPKNFYFLGRHWQEARDYEKAVTAFDKFLEWTPPADDQKLVAANQTNREGAHKSLIDVYFRMKKYDKSSAAAEKCIADYSSSSDYPSFFDQLGQAQRMAGAEDKAIESFSKAAELKYLRGYLDLIDVHLANGNLDAAKQAITKYSEDVGAKNKELVAWNKSLVESIGSDAPALDKNVAPVYGASDAPKDWSRIVIFYRFGPQTNNADAKLANIQDLQRLYRDKAVAVGIATYMHYDVDKMKVDPDLPKDKEVDGITRLLGQTTRRIPPCILVEPEFLDAIHAKYENQITIVDTKGKLRYARSNEEKPYDYLAAELALKKIIGEK